jgi:RHS repeat-associated protein
VSSNSYLWNAESEIKTAGGLNYSYDGDGDRVEKSNGKIYWYGAGSQVLDESDGSGNITDEYVYFGGKRVAHRVVSGNSVYYYAEDLLGSSRALATSAGALCYDADFYPYGGEHDYTNTCAQNYKFTGKERDPETNNDDFDARYYSSAYGRFLSADWSSTPAPVPYANLTNPQTLNLYAMVSDNPESFADLDGHANYSQSNEEPGACTDSGTPACSGQITAQNAAAQNAGTAQDQTAQNRSVFRKLLGKIGNFFAGIGTPFIRWGKLGGPAHRAEIARQEKALKEQGYTVRREVNIKTPNGAKSSRWADLEGTKDGETVYVQVGRQNKNGTPVAREVQAMEDIEGATDIRPRFAPYNNIEPAHWEDLPDPAVSGVPYCAYSASCGEEPK